MTEPGPGSGGAKRQKSSTELTVVRRQRIAGMHQTSQTTNCRGSGKSMSGCFRSHTCSCRSDLSGSDQEDCPGSRSRCTSGHGRGEQRRGRPEQRDQRQSGTWWAWARRSNVREGAEHALKGRGATKYSTSWASGAVMDVHKTLARAWPERSLEGRRAKRGLRVSDVCLTRSVRGGGAKVRTDHDPASAPGVCGEVPTGRDAPILRLAWCGEAQKTRFIFLLAGLLHVFKLHLPLSVPARQLSRCVSAAVPASP
jgi:hypothetical protein